VAFTATGKMRYASAAEDSGPDGLPRGFMDLIRILPFNDAGRGAVIGRIGEKETGQAFLIGAKREIVAPANGRLSIGINQTSNDTGDGAYDVRIEIYPAAVRPMQWRDRLAQFRASIPYYSPKSRDASATKMDILATWRTF
jgi:hypothetical protein